MGFTKNSDLICSAELSSKKSIFFHPSGDIRGKQSRIVHYPPLLRAKILHTWLVLLRLVMQENHTGRSKPRASSRYIVKDSQFYSIFSSNIMKNIVGLSEVEEE